MTNVRMVFRDPGLPHQIVIFVEKGTHRFGVSCNCMKKAHNYEAFEKRGSLEAEEAQEIWLMANHNENIEPFDWRSIWAARRHHTYRTT